VLKQFAQRARETTRKRPSERVALLVMIDGDNVGCALRKQQLDDMLVSTGEARRSTEEPIVILVPTWSVETWLLGLTDESSSFKDSLRAGEETAAMFELVANRLKERLLDDAPPSLRDARVELDRLPT
jgi:hypothetical protein